MHASPPIPIPLALFLLFLVAAPGPAPAAGKPPHIVLVMADDQGWGDVAYNGHPVVETPNLDAAAAAGLRFDRFYAAAPVCSPTRASVLTGRHPNRMGVFSWGHPMRPQERTLAEALGEAGYTTGHFGKWHLGSVRHGSPASPGANGFDRWLSAPNFYDNDAVMSDEGIAVPLQGESSAIAADAAIAWMQEVSQEEAPFCAVVWFGSPHVPHRAADEDRARYADQPEGVRDFLGEITGLDRAFGKLRDALDALGIRRDTVLWYCSDNGALPRVGSTGGLRGQKGDVYEGGLLVPAILEWPAQIPRPRSTAFRASTSDIYPTLMEIAGIPTGDQPPLDGISLVPLVAGLADERPAGMGFWQFPTRGILTSSKERMEELLVAQVLGFDLPPQEPSLLAAELPDPPYPADTFPGHAAWIDGDWKLHRLQDKDDQVKWELYHLVADPGETTDLAGRHQQRVARYGRTLEDWLNGVVQSLNGGDY